MTNASFRLWFLTALHEKNQFRNKLEECKRKMGKLSNILLKSLFFVAAEAQTFAVTSCNASVSHHCSFSNWLDFLKDNTPALTFRIEQPYFENNLASQTNDFVFADGFYSRTIPQNELQLGFDNNTDGKFYKFIFFNVFNVL